MNRMSYWQWVGSVLGVVALLAAMTATLAEVTVRSRAECGTILAPRFDDGLLPVADLPVEPSLALSAVTQAGLFFKYLGLWLWPHPAGMSIDLRVDFAAGHDAPFFVANGLFEAFTGFDATSGFGVAGPASFRQMNRIGIDLPQFYVEAHLPHVLTEKGIDIRAGRFYTLMGREVYPGKDTDFYSRTFENVVVLFLDHFIDLLSAVRSSLGSCADLTKTPRRLETHHGHTFVSVPGIVGSQPHTRAREFQNSNELPLAFRSQGSGSGRCPMKAVMRT